MRKSLSIVLAVVLLLGVAIAVIFSPKRSANIDSFAECAKAGFPVTDTNPPTCNDGRQTYVGPLGTPEPSAVPISTLDFATLVEGDSKGTYPQKNQLITSQAQWDTFWRQVHAGLPSLPPQIPVDFAKYSVIAITMGPEPTDGYTARMLSLQMVGTTAQAEVQLRAPDVSCHLPSLKTGPYFIAQIPRITALPKFNVETVTHKCSS